ncbi:MAG TPA: hypothetical protein VNL69_05745, partial [Bacteroidota bacterium]|nr:hypothetical protein [Bacteroidota bacterium]
MRSRIACVCFAALVMLQPVVVEAEASQWEQRFRAIPEPARIRAYMQRLSARPHHIGSQYGKENAEWILA